MRERKKAAEIPLVKVKPETLQAYRDKNREKLNTYAREWKMRKRREAGIEPRPEWTPERKVEWYKQWNEANRDKRLEYVRKYRERHPEKVTAYQEKYNDENRERKRLYAEQRRRERGVTPMKRGKMSRAEEGRLYRERHPEQIREKERRYRKNNPEAYRRKGRLDTGRRRIRKANLPGSHTMKEWIELCAKFGNRCVCCGVHESVSTLARDHVIPITKPLSTDDISNIQPLCQPCNSKKGNRHTMDYRDTPFQNRGQSKLF